MALKDLMGVAKNKGKFSLKKELDFWLVTGYEDLGSFGKGKSGNLHPSGISGCIRKQVYKRIQVPAKAPYAKKGETQRIFDNGSSFHMRMQDYYKRMNILYGDWKCKQCDSFCKFQHCLQPQCPKGFPVEWVDGQELKPKFTYEELGFLIPEYGISGYTDGVIVHGDDWYIVEFKSIREDKYKALTGPLPEHNEQAQLYIYAFEKQLDKKFKGIIFQYECKNNQEIKEYIVEKDDEVLSRLFNKAKEYWECLEVKRLPARVCRTLEEGRWCEYKDTCFNDYYDLYSYWKNLEV